NNDVTPQPLYQADPGAVQPMLFVDEISVGSASDQPTLMQTKCFFKSPNITVTKALSSRSHLQRIFVVFIRVCSYIFLLDVKVKKDTEKEQVTEDMLKDITEVFISETDTFSLLDMPSTFVCVDADEAEATIARNHQYEEVCRNRVSKHVERSVQTLTATTKNKHVQSNGLMVVDAGEAVILTPTFIKVLNTPRSVYLNMNVKIVMSEIIFSDPECPVKNEMVEQRTGGTDGGPSLQCLWVFSCELSRGRSVSCMTWNRKNPDLLAVGHGEFDSGNQKPGLVSCWSIKNLKWPEHVIHCDSAVTALDFSANSPSQLLAVGTHDGSITIHSVAGRLLHTESKPCYCSSPNRHLGPVWQLRWTQQQVSSTGEEKVEALLSVGADGRISKWFFFKDGLDCIDLMKLRRIQNTEKQTGGKRTEMMTETVLTALTPGLCFDFHPTDSSIYLTGTWEGLIHQCSCSNSQQFLETYRKHFCPVNCVAWSPFNPDVFLSCSSDWTIQLWKQHHLKPVLGFTSAQKAVYDIKWSPKWPTVFGAVTEGQLEIWDLSLNNFLFHSSNDTC
uniref:Dynein axonemal intermediate chain 4 n=1 Tax=Neolamprologus brichardi TaxID=32507 RepID=A0A3Q4HSZ4_NEOBR